MAAATSGFISFMMMEAWACGLSCPHDGSSRIRRQKRKLYRCNIGLHLGIDVDKLPACLAHFFVPALEHGLYFEALLLKLRRFFLELLLQFLERLCLEQIARIPSPCRQCLPQ